jgi:hypothetical protein
MHGIVVLIILALIAAIAFIALPEGGEKPENLASVQTNS